MRNRFTQTLQDLQSLQEVRRSICREWHRESEGRYAKPMAMSMRGGLYEERGACIVVVPAEALMAVSYELLFRTVCTAVARPENDKIKSLCGFADDGLRVRHGS